MGGPGMGGGSYRGSGSPMSRDNGRPMGGPQSSNNIPCKYNRELVCRDYRTAHLTLTTLLISSERQWW